MRVEPVDCQAEIPAGPTAVELEPIPAPPRPRSHKEVLLTMPDLGDDSMFERSRDLGRGDPAPEAARYVLGIDFRAEDKERMNVLSAKAQDGSMTPEEQEELDGYIQVSHLLALMQSKARKSLNASGR